MRKLLVFTAAATLLLTGCSGTPQAEFAPDPDAFVAGVRAEGGEYAEYVGDTGILELGEALCDVADEAGDFESASDTIRSLSAGDSAEKVQFYAALAASAEVFLCEPQ